MGNRTKSNLSPRPLVTKLIANEYLERVVLSSILWNNNLYDIYPLSSDLFHYPKFKAIFQIIKTLMERDGHADIPSVYEYVRQARTNNENDPLPSESEIFDLFPDASHNELFYGRNVNILKCLSCQRKSVLASVNYIDSCQFENLTDIERQGNLLIDILEKTQEQTTLLLDILNESIDQYQEGEFSQYSAGVDEENLRGMLRDRGNRLSTGYIFDAKTNPVELTIAPKALTGVVGSTGHCKTTFLMNLACRLAKRYPEKRVLFISYEESLENIELNMLNVFAGIPLGKNNREIISNFTQEEGVRQVASDVLDSDKEDYFNFLDNRFLKKEFSEVKSEFFNLIREGRLNIQQMDFPVNKLISYVKWMKRRGLCDILMFDYIQLIEDDSDESLRKSRDEVLKSICLRLKDLAIHKSYGLPIIFGVQFNRQVKSPYDLHCGNIGEAGGIERTCDTVIGLWNCQKTEDPGDDDKRAALAEYQGTKNFRVDAIFAKILKRRGYSSGITGTFPFDGNTGRIYNTSDPSPKTIFEDYKDSDQGNIRAI